MECFLDSFFENMCTYEVPDLLQSSLRSQFSRTNAQAACRLRLRCAGALGNFALRGI
jgi:hypothetical protein